MDGIRYLRVARRHLERPTGSPRDRLRLAVPAFGWAMTDAASWPEGIRGRALLIAGQLLTAGVMNGAIETMGHPAVQAVSAEMLALCDAADASAGWPVHHPL